MEVKLVVSTVSSSAGVTGIVRVACWVAKSAGVKVYSLVGLMVYGKVELTAENLEYLKLAAWRAA